MLNADYLHYDNENPIDYVTDYSDEEGQLLFNERINSDKNTPLDIVVGALDYSHRVSEQVRLEAGVKAVNTSLTNEVAVVAQTPQSTLPPEDLNGIADLDEMILAAYTSLDYINGRLDFSQRTFRLICSRSFGNQKLRGVRQRATGSDTERGRVN